MDRGQASCQYLLWIRRAGQAAERTRVMKTPEQEMQERVMLTLDTMNEGIWDWPDVTVPRFWWSHRYYEIIGYSPDELEPTLDSVLRLVHPDDVERLRAQIQANLQQSEPVDVEYRIITKSGECRWLLGHGKVIRNEAGVISRMLGTVRDITARKRVEDALKESQERLNHAIEATDEGLWDWPDVSQPYNWWSPRFFTLLGYQPGEIVPSPDNFMAHIHPDDVARMHTELAERMQSTQRFRSEYRIRTKSGAYRWFVSRGQLFPGQPGQPTRMSGSIQDITELKDSLAARRASDEHYRELIEHLTVAVVVHEPDSRIRYANPIACRLLGLSLDQMLGKDAMDPDWYFFRTNGERVPLADYPVMRVLATGQPVYNLIAGINRPLTGDVAWGLINAFPEFDDQHRLVQIVVTFSDISERIQTEKALQRSETKYRLLHESMRDAYAQTDMEGRIIDTNSAFRSLLGYSMEELQQRTFYALTLAKWHASERKIIAEQVLLRGYSDVYEKEYQRKDGTIVPVELRTVLMLDEDKRPVGMWALVRDITERKKIEQSLQQAKIELEERVADRTADLRYTNQLLRDLTSSLLASEDEERLRIAQLVHDSIVQTLSLARIRLGSTSQILRDAQLDEESQEVNQIRDLLRDAIGQSRSLVSDLAPPILYEVGLLPALQDLATRLAQEHKVAISVQVHSPHPPLDHKHRGLLFQCTRELLLNAIKHAQTYSFDVILNGDKYWATVTVEDHGQGFDVHNLHAKRQNDGNGFGLFHIRQRVEGLGGIMNIESAPKKGTRITLCIPLGNPPGSPDSATRSN